jgi:hypothetical protein
MNTDTDAVQMPPMPSNISHVMRRIRRCEGETAAQLVLEHFAMEYARAALVHTAEQADAVRVGWTGHGEADNAIILLGRLDVSADDDLRVDQIERAIRHLAKQALAASSTGDQT